MYIKNNLVNTIKPNQIMVYLNAMCDYQGWQEFLTLGQNFSGIFYYLKINICEADFLGYIHLFSLEGLI